MNTCSVEGCGVACRREMCQRHRRKYRRENEPAYRALLLERCTASAQKRKAYEKKRYEEDADFRERAKARSRERYSKARAVWVARGCPPRTDTAKHNRAKRAKIYGLTVEQLGALEVSQDNRCAICRDLPLEGFSLCVDHCHITGHVRGLLCIRCNRAIGLLRDDPRLLASAIVYLGRPA